MLTKYIIRGDTVRQYYVSDKKIEYMFLLVLYGIYINFSMKQLKMVMDFLCILVHR